MTGNLLVKGDTSVSTDTFRILIVDDDVDIGDALRDILELEDDNYEVAVATNARDAEVLAREFCPDLALLDIKLGRSSGLDLVPLLRRQIPGIFCIMMTAFRDSEYAVTAVKFGADDYMLKPVDPDKLLATLRDFRVRKVARDQQREAERRFRAVFEQTFQMLFIIGPEGRLIDVNAVAAEFIGEEKKDLVGRDFLALPMFVGREPCREKIQTACASAVQGELARFECAMGTEQEQELSFDCSAKAIRDDFGFLEYIVLEARDVTVIRQAERKVRAINEELEQRVQERTEELQEARLRAEAASEAKTRFLSRMSHELRTPMNAILGFSQLLAMDASLDKDQQEFVEEIMNAGGHLLDLINEVLDLTRIESGKFHLQLKDVDFGAILNECLSLTGNLAVERSVTVRSSLPEAPVFVRADYLRLKQVLVNLISNAIKYNVPDGSVDVSCKLASGRLQISVTDTGIGISEQNQQRIFQPFEVVDDNYNSDGVGIGLSIVAQLVAMMQGELGVESEQGKGSRFWFSIPLGQAAAQSELESQQPDGARGMVLCLEPDTAHQRLMGEILKKRPGVALHSVTSVDQALTMSRQRDYDLILLDLDQWDEDGGALAALAAEARQRDVPVVALCAAEPERDQFEGPDHVFADYLTRPIEMNVFLDVVDWQLRRRQD